MQWFLTEDGLYEVLFQYKTQSPKEFKEELKKFIKTIRKTGGYIATKQDDAEIRACHSGTGNNQRRRKAKAA